MSHATGSWSQCNNSRAPGIEPPWMPLSLSPAMTRLIISSLLLLNLVNFIAPPSRASSHPWPQFRGPLGDGHSPATDVPLHWSATSNLAWKISVPGRGWSSPVLANGRIFLTSAVHEGASNRFALLALAFDAATGHPVWQTTVFPPSPSTNANTIHSKNSHASPTPIADGNRLFVHFGPLGTACLDLDGRPLWRNNSIDFEPKHGNGGSPILVDGRLIFTCDGSEEPFVAALDATNGQLAWRAPRNAATTRKFSFGTPTSIVVDGKTQVISPGSGVAVAYSPVDGSELWRVRHEGYSVIPKPLFGHGLIYLGTGFNSPVALAIRPGGTGDVTDSHVAWSQRRGAGQTPSFLLIGDELYLLADNGILTCVDAKTGEIHYQERACGQSSASPIFADGRIYLLDEQGLGAVIAPGKEFRKLADNPIGERTLASYAVTDGTLFIRSEQNLYRIGTNP